MSVPGAELLGPLPAELQAMNVISAVIVMTATEPDAATVLFKFLTSPAAARIIKAAGNGRPVRSKPTSLTLEAMELKPKNAFAP